MTQSDETEQHNGLVRPGAAQHPLGRLVYRVRSQRPTQARALAAVVLATAAGLLFGASRVEPDPRGLGSHEQFGMPPCVSITLLGIPCPTCGVTTAFAHTVRGELRSAFIAQPAGMLLALAAIAAAVLSLGTVATGNVWRINWYRMSPTRVTVTLLAVLLAGWLFKIVMVAGAAGAAGGIP